MFKTENYELKVNNEMIDSEYDDDFVEFSESLWIEDPLDNSCHMKD